MSSTNLRVEVIDSSLSINLASKRAELDVRVKAYEL